MSRRPTAAFIIIGNEILSGRTQDANLRVLAERLAGRGIVLKEVRVVADEYPAIIAAVQGLCAAYDNVFTSGGIGPTHDDITAEAVARAFGRVLIMHPEAEKLLRDYYAEKITSARLRMARVPEGAELIANPVSLAPGFRMDNLYVMAGVPDIFRAMVDGVLPSLATGPAIHSRVLSARIPESQLADGLTALQADYPSVDIGSYPKLHQGSFAVSIVCRSTDAEALNRLMPELKALMQGYAETVIEGELD